MLPELILREEEKHNYKALSLLGLVSGLVGIWVANNFFTDQASLIAPLIAAVPMVFPLMSYYFEYEENPDFMDETMAYGSLFIGLVTAFFIGALLMPDFFTTQLNTTGLTGQATNLDASFLGVSSHNLTLFVMILGVSAFLGSAGAFILSLNASMVGVFFATLASDLTGLEIILSNSSPLAYFPHTSLEMTGFIIAGVLGTTASASIYREHLSWEHWLQLSKLFVVGVTAIIGAAFIETV